MRRRSQPGPRFHTYSDSANLRIRIHFLVTLIKYQWTINISFSANGCELRPHYWQVTRWKAPEFKAPRVLIAAFPALPLCWISKPRNLKLTARKPNKLTSKTSLFLFNFCTLHRVCITH